MFEPYLMGQYQYPWGGVTPPPNWQRTKTMNRMAEVKVLVDSYK